MATCEIVLFSLFALTKKMLSYLISTFNRRDVLRRHLQLLEDQTYQGPFEVIVCDDGSTDGTHEMLLQWGSPRFQLVLYNTGNTEINTAAKSRNNGIRAARGEIVIFADDDCLPNPRLIEQFLLNHRPDRIQLGYKGSTPDYLDMPIPAKIESDTNMSKYWQSWVIGKFAHFQTGSCCMSIQAARTPAKDGNLGFDERFVGYGHEDTELGRRLYRAGYKPFFNINAISWHTPKAPQQEKNRKAMERQQTDEILKKILMEK